MSLSKALDSGSRRSSALNCPLRAYRSLQVCACACVSCAPIPFQRCNKISACTLTTLISSFGINSFVSDGKRPQHTDFSENTAFLLSVLLRRKLKSKGNLSKVHYVGLSPPFSKCALESDRSVPASSRSAFPSSYIYILLLFSMLNNKHDPSSFRKWVLKLATQLQQTLIPFFFFFCLVFLMVLPS